MRLHNLFHTFVGGEPGHLLVILIFDLSSQESSVTPTEYRLLCQFLMNRGQLLTYDLLLERLWDSGGQFVDRHALAVNINRLRGKIEDENHRYISNVYGMGYQWIG